MYLAPTQIQYVYFPMYYVVFEFLESTLCLVSGELLSLRKVKQKIEVREYLEV